MINRVALLSALLASTLSAEIIHIGSVTQYKELNKGALITMFTASWCGPCKNVKPLYIKLSDEYNDVTFGMIDFDNQELMKAVDPSIKSVPTFVFTHKGNELDRTVGAMSKGKLKSFIEKSRAAALGKEYKEQAPKLLTADEYYKKGLKDYAAIVEGCLKKDITSADMMGFQKQDEQMTILGEACMKPETTKEAFELIKAYNRGVQKALETYKPHQLLQDSFITYCKNCAKFILAASDFAAVTEWQMATMMKAQQKAQIKILDIMWPIIAEESTN